MALIKCGECGREISNMAYACQHCGFPVEDNEAQLYRFQWEGEYYNIASVIRQLNFRNMEAAEDEIMEIFSECLNDHFYDNTIQLIEFWIWNRYIQYQEKRYPDQNHTNIPYFNCNDFQCEIYRVIWWLERNDLQRAKAEIEFAFPYGYVGGFADDVKKINEILGDIQSIYKDILKNHSAIIYPTWFLQWKRQTSIKTEERINNKIQSASTQTAEESFPRCPNCGSTDLTKKGAMARAMDGFVFGRLSVEGRAQWKCNKCGHLW